MLEAHMALVLCRLVHRLDKDASGCLVIARTSDSAAWLSQAFAQHSNAALHPALVHTGATVQREYIALVEQSTTLAASPQGTITDPLMGSGGVLQPATTLYKTLCSNERVALGANTSSDSILLQRCLLQSLEMQDMARQGLCYIGNS
ncbi:hypothetical protein ABBQ38_012894 [Trebouxia sp. C0009 RCD-2024]